MKKLFLIACAALSLTFASCGSKSAENTTDQQNQTTEQTQVVQQEAVQEVVNQVLVDLTKKLNAFKAKVEASSKADAGNLLTEAKSIKDEIDAASLTDEEKAGLVETFNAIVEIAKNLK
ncbi:MAG: hypothetical protein MJ211_00335 [Bacteroidales bacterium]|nr:hypothetical protein [Bacteroidales bacterium]